MKKKISPHNPSQEVDSEQVNIFAKDFLACPEALVRVVRGLLLGLLPPGERAERLIQKTHLYILEQYEPAEERGAIPKGSSARYALAAGVAKASN